MLTCATIFGVNLGFEIMTKATCQLMDEDAQWV